MLVERQNSLRDLVAAESLLQDRPVLVEDKNNLVSVLEQALQTNTLAVVVALARGNAGSNQVKSTPNSDDQYEVVIHRGLLDDASVPSTIAVVDALVPRIHGAPVKADAAPLAPALRWRYVSHEIRENGDGTYARAVIFAATGSW